MHYVRAGSNPVQGTEANLMVRFFYAYFFARTISDAPSRYARVVLCWFVPIAIGTSPGHRSESDDSLFCFKSFSLKLRRHFLTHCDQVSEKDDTQLNYEINSSKSSMQSAK